MAASEHQSLGRSVARARRKESDRSGPPSPALLDEGPDRSVPAYYETIVRLPGYQGQPQRCIPLQPVGFCEDRGHVVLGRSDCQVRGCPEHWIDWVKKSVINQVARLAAYRYTQEGWGRRMVHAVMSPPQGGTWSADDLFDTRSDAYEVAEGVGARGGLCIPHPYRVSDLGEEIWTAATETGGADPELGKWKLMREVAGDEWDRMLELVEAAPHYHMLAAVGKTDEWNPPEGWVAKNVRSVAPFEIDDLEAYQDMARVSWYLLTHSAVQAGRQTMTYFGDVHPAAFDPAAELEPEAWEQIQEMAARAVNETPEATEAEGTIEGMECPNEDCESEVVPLRRLTEYLNDREWFDRLDAAQRNRLKGLFRWWEGGDRPPPGAQGDREAMLRWLESIGRANVDRPGPQTGAGSTFVSLRAFQGGQSGP